MFVINLNGMIKDAFWTAINGVGIGFGQIWYFG